MTPKAIIDKMYLARILLLTIMFGGFGVAFFYDGFIKYPWQQRVAMAYEEFKNDNRPDKESWDVIAAREGYPDASQGDPAPRRSDNDIKTQRWAGFLVMPIGLFFAGALARFWGRSITVDERGVVTSWGPRADFDAIVSMNKERWKSKGIAVVTYKDGQIERRLVLDDWKFNRAAITQIVEIVQSQLRPEQIVGDVPPPSTPETVTPPQV